ncbi:MAG: GNAT family N-acetyltransferase [Lachnospiraceae bacterium]|nr:GNAT family N-acetyltransferase [Lachnospiraceae bacterium]
MRRATRADIPAIVSLTCECFGENYTFDEEMQGFIDDERNRVYVEYDDKGLCGAFMMLAEDKDSISESMEVTSDDYDRLSRGKPCLHHKFCVVREDRRKDGLMTAMLQEAIPDLENEGIYGAIFAQTWILNNEIPMARVCDRIGYKQYKRQFRPWYGITDRYCNICKGRCKCDAMVYYRQL